MANLVIDAGNTVSPWIMPSTKSLIAIGRASDVWTGNISIFGRRLGSDATTEFFIEGFTASSTKVLDIGRQDQLELRFKGTGVVGSANISYS